MIKAAVKTIETTDGLKLKSLHWLVPDPKAHIFIVHGLGEHIARYEHVAAFFNREGFSVSGFDLRGHGNSEGPKGYSPSYDQFMKDISTFVKESSIGEVSKILYGHSMGGNLVLNYILDHASADAFKLCIATSPWIKLYKEPSGLLKGAAKLLNRFGGFTNSNDLDASDISSIQEEVDKYVNDPLVHDKVSSIAALAIMNAGDALLESQKKFPIPLLLNHGSADKITSHKGTMQFVKKQDNDLINIKIWEDQFHELHNDKEADQLFEHCKTWINKLL